MSSPRWIPARQMDAEIRVSNSIFIATAAPVFSVEEARETIQNIKQRYQDATHNVPVYIIGHPPSVIEHSNDDGEPSGTAGRPALSVLRGSGFGDIAIVITRYFGGTKLGTGGLVRAYSDATREVLSILPKAQKIATVTSEFNIPYAMYDQVQRIADNHKGTIIDPIFQADIQLAVRFVEEDFTPFQQAIIQLSNGTITPKITSSNPNEIVEI
jgi:uncharacterized YigZ family protein